MGYIGFIAASTCDKVSLEEIGIVCGIVYCWCGVMFIYVTSLVNAAILMIFIAKAASFSSFPKNDYYTCTILHRSPLRQFDRSNLLSMSKDGKKKKPKKPSSTEATAAIIPTAASSTSSSITQTSTSELAPSRVSNQINVPIRQQIAWAKALKRLEASQNSQQSYVTSRKFKQINEPKPQEEYVEVDYKNVRPPAVFVDGYNIIGYINRVERRSVSMDEARDCLISDLSVLKGATGWWIEVIFDAYMTSNPERREIRDSMLVTFTGSSETADNHIERRFEELRLQGYTNMVVATDDSALRMCAGSLGAGYLTAAMLLEEMRIAYQGWEIMAENLARENRLKRPTLEDNLTSDVKAAIESLRADRRRASDEAEAARQAARAAVELARARKKKEQSKSVNTGSVIAVMGESIDGNEGDP